MYQYMRTYCIIHSFFSFVDKNELEKLSAWTEWEHGAISTAELFYELWSIKDTNDSLFTIISKRIRFKKKTSI